MKINLNKQLILEVVEDMADEGPGFFSGAMTAAGVGAAATGYIKRGSIKSYAKNKVDSIKQNIAKKLDPAAAKAKQDAADLKAKKEADAKKATAEQAKKDKADLEKYRKTEKEKAETIADTINEKEKSDKIMEDARNAINKDDKNSNK